MKYLIFLSLISCTPEKPPVKQQDCGTVVQRGFCQESTGVCSVLLDTKKVIYLHAPIVGEVACGQGRE